MKKIEKINLNERFNDIIWNMLYKSWQASFFEIAIKSVFASYHPSVSESGTESPEMVVSMAIYAMLGMDMQFYGDEISNAMVDAGFKAVQSKDIITCYGKQRRDITRKAK